MDDVLIEKVRLLWISCEEALEDMNVLYDHKRYRACVGRAYYAMFYAASALLMTRNMEFSKHSGVISAFGREFVKADTVDPRYHMMLREGFALRQKADYDYRGEVDASAAKVMIEFARTFRDMARTHLEERGIEV